MYVRETKKKKKKKRKLKVWWRWQEGKRDFSPNIWLLTIETFDYVTLLPFFNIGVGTVVSLKMMLYYLANKDGGKFGIMQ